MKEKHIMYLCFEINLNTKYNTTIKNMLIHCQYKQVLITENLKLLEFINRLKKVKNLIVNVLELRLTVDLSN